MRDILEQEGALLGGVHLHRYEPESFDRPRYAKQVFTNGYLSINGVDVSSLVSDITLDLTAADVDVTSMGAGGKQRLQGLQDNKITANFWQDFTAGETDQTLSALFQSGSVFPATVMADKGAASSTNPWYSGLCIIIDYPAIAGKVGDGLAASVQMVVSGTITRGTTGP